MSAILTGVEADIVARLLDGVAYLKPENGGTVRGVADTKTALEINGETPPFVLVEYAGEDAGPPINIGSARQLTRFKWDLFCGAQNFNADGSGRNDDADTGEKGVYTLIDDIATTLPGYKLPSVTGTTSKLFWGGALRWSLADAKVVYVVHLWHDVLRCGS